MFHTKHPISHGRRLRALLVSALVGLTLGLFWTSPAIGAVAQSPLLVTTSVRPNILLILDNSDSQQEGLSEGRVGLDWENCSPGPGIDSTTCPAGARYENSKASIAKRVGLNLVNNFQGQLNLGLMTYQQYPASDRRNDVFDAAGTVLWRLTHRMHGVRTSDNANPAFYQPDHNEAWDSDTKRFREWDPVNNEWLFYNVAVPGYWRAPAEDTGIPTDERDLFCDYTGTPWEDDSFPHECNIPGFAANAAFNITLTDSMRQRGVTNTGHYTVFLRLDQLEWRSNHSPGLGYLHVPIGGLDENDLIEANHWDALRTKLQPQRLDWEPGDGNVMTDPAWPVIAAGLTPLEGTMLTARDYFIGENANFGAAQGNIGVPDELPESCGANSIIWLTDGLPSVAPDGTALGDDPTNAVLRARDAIADLYSTTEDRLGSPVDTHIVGFALPPGLDDVLTGAEFDGLDDPLDILAQAGGTPRIRDADNEAELDDIMADLLAQIVQDAQSSSASIATNSTRLDTDTLIYQARFDTRDWSGQLLAFRLEADGTVGEQVWDASEEVPGHNNRDIFTWDPDNEVGQHFHWADLTLTQQTVLNDDPVLLDWLRGNQTVEDGVNYRVRNRTVLGSVVNSDPMISAGQNFGFDELPGDEGDTYRAYLDDKSTRREVLYFGANDGMLHGVDATADNLTGGEEVLAFVPNGIYNNLPQLADPERTHQYFVDGAPTISDAWNSDTEKWRTVLVGATGAGGGSVFALDITDPDNFSRHDVLWEFEDEHMHHSTSMPSIVRINTGQWVAVFGNGHGEGAYLYVVELFSGDLIRKIKLVEAGENGLASPAPVSMDGNRRIADTVYAGDMTGNMWRIDISAGNTGNWGSYFRQGPNEYPLFEARGPNDEVQPITSRPALTRDPDGGVMVLFGTGAFFRTGDAIVPTTQAARDVQTFYGLRDTGNRITDGGDLQPQEITHEGDLGGFGFDLRVTTDHAAGDRGWYLDLISPVHNRQTERVVSRALVIGERVVFATMIPDDQPCGFGGTSWLMEMNAVTGSRLEITPFDLDGDGNFNENDWVEVIIDGEPVRVPVSGKRSEVGVIKTPGVVTAGDSEYKYTSGSSGEIEKTRESGGSGGGRQSWQQLR